MKQKSENLIYCFKLQALSSCASWFIIPIKNDAYKVLNKDFKSKSILETACCLKQETL